MTLLPDNALSACWKKIEELKEGEEIVVSEVAPRHPELWRACAKQWVDCYPYLGEFSANFERFRKLGGIIE